MVHARNDMSLLANNDHSLPIRKASRFFCVRLNWTGASEEANMSSNDEEMNWCNLLIVVGVSRIKLKSCNLFWSSIRPIWVNVGLGKKLRNAEIALAHSKYMATCYCSRADFGKWYRPRVVCWWLLPRRRKTESRFLAFLSFHLLYGRNFSQTGYVMCGWSL